MCGVQAEQEQGQVKWAAIVFAQRQTCCLTLHLLCQRIQSWASTLRTGAATLFSRHCLSCIKLKFKSYLGPFRPTCTHIITRFDCSHAGGGQGVEEREGGGAKEAC